MSDPTTDRTSPQGITVVVPAFNEAAAIEHVVHGLSRALEDIGRTAEILVVDDGSTDDTHVRAQLAGARVIRHPANGGYGRALLTGIEAARHDVIAIVDGDNSYPIARLPDLIRRYDDGFDMVVGARQGHHYAGSVGKQFLRAVFRWLSEFTCGRDIPDVNSGFRIFRRDPILKARQVFPSGFSFTTTATLLFMLNNLFVAYVPVAYEERHGRSKVRLVRDGLRALQIIVTTIAQYNPVKLHLLILVLNAVGNLALMTIGAWSGPGWTAALVGWNTSCLIAAIAVIGLMLVGIHR